MLTSTIIAKLKNDSGLRTLIGATSASNASICASAARIQLDQFLIVVDYVIGETEHPGYEHGVITIEVYAKSGINNVVGTISSIMTTINTLLDLKGSSLNDSYTSIVYRMRKLSGDMDFDETRQAHVGTLVYEFYSSMVA